MKSFDEWHKDTDSLCHRRAFEAGQQSKQAEIDELCKNLKKNQEKIMRIQIAISNRLGNDDEIDSVLNYFDKILKGNTNED